MEHFVFRRGWEFWLGLCFVVVSVTVVGAAFVHEGWATRVSGMGAAIAAFAVVGAAFIAYDGTTATIRSQYAAQARSRAADLSRLQVATFDFLNQVNDARAQVERDMNGISGPGGTFAAADEYQIVEPPEFAVAWSRLEILPDGLIQRLANVRIRLSKVARRQRRVERMAEQLPRNTMNLVSEMHSLAIELGEVANGIIALNHFLADERGSDNPAA